MHLLCLDIQKDHTEDMIKVFNITTIFQLYREKSYIRTLNTIYSMHSFCTVNICEEYIYHEYVPVPLVEPVVFMMLCKANHIK